jgi:D-amino-acid dehydrogenase
MKVIVLGGGIIGTTSAWYLRQAGHEVTVIDRQPGVAMETSFANGGQISVSHAEPWANPRAPFKVLRWLAREDAPLLFRLRADAAQWRWGLRFLMECLPSRTRGNTVQLVRLGLYSRSALQNLRRDAKLHYDELEKGILHFYSHAEEFEAAQRSAQLMREQGCEIDMLDKDEILKIEPALKNALPFIAGASISPRDESGDAHQFTQALARHAAELGVVFRYGTSVRAIQGGQGGSGRIEGVVCAHSEHGEDGIERETVVTADAYVVALGSYSPLLLRPLGIRLNLYPAKGYSATLPVERAELAYSVSLTDDEHKLVFSRLGQRLRIAGTAEFTGYDTSLNPVRCQALVKRLLQLFPGIADPAKALYWAGLRPATPSNLPYIGRTRYANLFLNTGHGTLGWTHSCGSGRALADIVSGRRPEVDFAFTGL